MTTMISEVYAAFKEAGIPEDKARSAAESLSAENLATKSDINRIDNSLTKLDDNVSKLVGDVTTMKTDVNMLDNGLTKLVGDVTTLKSDVKDINNQLKKQDKELLIIKWMLGLIVSIQVIPLIKTFLV